jgi:hypothetical protein
MNTQNEREALRQFFGGYFHQDWHCDCRTPDEVLDRYSKAASDVEACSLGKAILEYGRSFDTDEELERKLFSDFGCYFMPSGLGMSAIAWLEQIANRLSRRCK